MTSNKILRIYENIIQNYFVRDSILVNVCRSSYFGFSTINPATNWVISGSYGYDSDHSVSMWRAAFRFYEPGEELIQKSLLTNIINFSYKLVS